MTDRGKVEKWIVRNYWLLATVYIAMIATGWAFFVPDDGEGLVCEKNIGSLMLMIAMLTALVMHVWGRLTDAEHRITELQGFIERLGEPEEEDSEELPDVEEHL